MRVCQVLGGNEDGGLEKHTIELSKQLKEKGIDVTVVAHKDFAPYFEDVTFISLDLSKGRKNIFILFKLYKILKNGNFDIIHSQANKATAMVANIKSFIKSSKFVATLHSFKKNLKAFEKMDYVITVSNRISNNLKNLNQQTIYNGIKYKSLDNIESIYEKYEIPKDKFLICAVGRLCDVKRFDILIKSLKSLDLFCILVGDGENKDSLIKLSKDENVYNKILFTGNIENNDVKKILSISNLTVISSEKEGFSYVFAESLLYNTPVISTDVADIKNIIGNDYIFDFDNPNSLNNKISTIQKNYDNEFEKFEPIFNYAKDNFTIEYMIVETIKIYNKVLK